MKESELEAVAWIFYSIALGSEAAPINRRDISSIADGINHAVPSESELTTSIRYLITLGFIQQTGKFFSLTQSGLAIVASARENSLTARSIWQALTVSLSEHRGGL